MFSIGALRLQLNGRSLMSGRSATLIGVSQSVKF
jgi:hypothetical protein